MERIDLYLQENIPEQYKNTSKENEMVTKVNALYCIAKAYRDKTEYVKPNELAKYRKAYKGKLNALDRETGEESVRKSKNPRKIVFEMIEAKIDNTIPMPRMQSDFLEDKPLSDITEEYLKYEIDKMLTEENNDKAERNTYVDGTVWYKVCWDSMNSAHGRNGDLRVDVLRVDQVVPEPNVENYRLMNYCFERSSMSLARIYDLYGKHIEPTSDAHGQTDVITYYYKNDNGIIGRLIYAEHSLQVISWDDSWQIRKIRVCKKCGHVTPVENVCPVCGHTHFRYRNAYKEKLPDDLYKLHNPYAEGKTTDPTNNAEKELVLPKGTEIPYYLVRQLPFVPRVALSSLDSLYGQPESEKLVEQQDSVNKILTKTEDKIMKSGAVVTKPRRANLDDEDETFKMLEVKSEEEARQVQLKQLVADVQGDIVVSNLLYESARATSGITESFQGKRDTTATSGKAKEFNAAKTGSRLESLRIMKQEAFAGVYELMFKYLLAFSDETRRFPFTDGNGNTDEGMWNKYMFLRKDENTGEIYYLDDFAFGTDPAATLSNNRVAMWQETTQQYNMGTLGDPADPRTREVYWNTLHRMGYPLAKYILEGMKNNAAHIPPELEQALLQNPAILQQAAALVNEGGEQRGGARPNSGPEGNGNTHAANVAKTNSKNAAKTKMANNTTTGKMSGGNI